MKVQLQTMTIKNFKGIQDLEVKAEGKNVRITGPNASGKTTIADAFFWCLFEKDSAGQAQFNLKPLDKEGKGIHHLDTVVEVFLIIDAKHHSFKKRFTEKWTKTRGSALKEFQGHTTDYFIDDIPMKKKDFNAKIEGLFNLKQFNLVTNPRAFNALHWTERRGLLLSISGEVSAQEVAAGDKETLALLERMDGLSIDDFRTRAKRDLREINVELKELPVRIQENQALAKNAKKPDKKVKAEQEKALAEAETEFNDLQNEKGMATLRLKKNELKTKILEQENIEAKKEQASRNKFLDKINAHTKKVRKVESNIETLEDNIKRGNSKAKALKEALGGLREEWAEIKYRQYDGGTDCPTCGQKLPQDQLLEAVEKFNSATALALKHNMKQGKETSKEADEQQFKIEEDQAKLKKQKKLLTSLKKEAKKMEADRVKAGKKKTDNKLLANLNAEYASLVKETEEHIKGTFAPNKKLLDRIAQIKEAIQMWDTQDVYYKAAQRTQARIAALEEQEKTLAAKYEAIQKDLFILEQYTLKQAGMVEANANKLFVMTQWRLFEEQINGGIVETCVAMYNGVPYPDLNSGAKIQVGLDIINTLSRHYDLQAPIWLDNRESLTWLPEMEAQIISMKVAGKNLIIKKEN